MIEFTFLKESMLIKQANQKSYIFVTVRFFRKRFKFQPNVCNACHGLLMMHRNLSNIGILNIKGSDYRCIISGIRKSKAINLTQNTDLIKR